MSDASLDRFIEDERDSLPAKIEVEGKTGTLDFDTLRTGGIIKQRQKGLFTVRLMCPGGRVPLHKLDKIIETARQYGGDYVHLSNRQSVEIPYVNLDDMQKVQQELSQVDQKIASCGPRVRVPTACSGCEYNPNGLADTQGMAQMVCEKFFAKDPLPHKFKITFSGCPIDCMRTNEHDLGFQGAVRPEWDEEECMACGICAEACAEGAIECGDDGLPVFDEKKCLFCGDCIRSCPSGSWTENKKGWMVRCGGKHGRHPFTGQKIAEFLPDDKVAGLVKAVVGWYKKNGAGKGRTRLAAILQDDSTWEKFLNDLKPALGEYAAENPRKPRPVEIHF